MATYFTIDGDPNEVAGAGARLQAMGQALNAQLKGPMAEIVAIDEERPWGEDEFGQGFEVTYNSVAEGTDTPLREVIRADADHAGERLEAVGKSILRAMAGFEATDGQAARDIAGSGDL